MSKVHLLRNLGNKQYEVVMHAAIPAGNNLAGHSWQSVWIAAGMNTTRLTTGSGPGQISAEEAAQIAAGSVMEFMCILPAESGGATQESLDSMVDRHLAGCLVYLGDMLKYYGYSY